MDTSWTLDNHINNWQSYQQHAWTFIEFLIGEVRCIITRLLDVDVGPIHSTKALWEMETIIELFFYQIFYLCLSRLINYSPKCSTIIKQIN